MALTPEASRQQALAQALAQAQAQATAALQAQTVPTLHGPAASPPSTTLATTLAVDGRTLSVERKTGADLLLSRSAPTTTPTAEPTLEQIVAAQKLEMDAFLQRPDRKELNDFAKTTETLIQLHKIEQEANILVEAYTIPNINTIAAKHVNHFCQIRALVVELLKKYNQYKKTSDIKQIIALKDKDVVLDKEQLRQAKHFLKNSITAGLEMLQKFKRISHLLRKITRKQAKIVGYCRLEAESMLNRHKVQHLQKTESRLAADPAASAPASAQATLTAIIPSPGPGPGPGPGPSPSPGPMKPTPHNDGNTIADIKTKVEDLSKEVVASQTEHDKLQLEITNWFVDFENCPVFQFNKMVEDLNEKHERCCIA